MREGLIILFTLLIGGCGNSHVPAPVFNAWLQPAARDSDYVVLKDDTIYSIAWKFGLDYSTLAHANHLKPPYSIFPGQRLKMTTVARGTAPKPAVVKPTTQQVIQAPVAVSVNHPVMVTPPPLPIWQWPATGKLVQRYSPTIEGNPGINIAGSLGSPVRAALSGEVVYCGNGVRGYGNLIIIKHNRHYLSAYAYNQHLLVKLGQRVSAGQTIATLGRDGIGQAMLHFEIRYDGRPVDPLRFLR